MNIDVILKEIEVLKWQVQLLKKNIEIKSGFDILVFEIDITKVEHDQIINLFNTYANNLNGDFSRYSFENEMVKINPIFGTNNQAVEQLLRDFAEEENEENLKKLFVKLYGHMKKFEKVFEEVR